MINKNLTVIYAVQNISMDQEKDLVEYKVINPDGKTQNIIRTLDYNIIINDHLDGLWWTFSNVKFD
jgi:hypothetical protein